MNKKECGLNKITRQTINPERTNADAAIREIYKFSRYELYQQSHAGWQMRTRTRTQIFRVWRS
jgi:hypothetical protein